MCECGVCMSACVSVMCVFDVILLASMHGAGEQFSRNLHIFAFFNLHFLKSTSDTR